MTKEEAIKELEYERNTIAKELSITIEIRCSPTEISERRDKLRKYNLIIEALRD